MVIRFIIVMNDSPKVLKEDLFWAAIHKHYKPWRTKSDCVRLKEDSHKPRME